MNVLTEVDNSFRVSNMWTQNGKIYVNKITESKNFLTKSRHWEMFLKNSSFYLFLSTGKITYNFRGGVLEKCLWKGFATLVKLQTYGFCLY